MRAPLSFAQERLWFLDQFMPDSALYNMPTAVSLSGHLDVRVLELALKEIVRRHEVLRTTFAMDGDRPVQVIAPETDFRISFVDLSDMPISERETQAQSMAIEEARLPFDLTKGPLLRARLLKLGYAEHMALLTMHHIASDGWSIGIFIRELATLYKAFLLGRPSPLPDLPIQYADFSEWQRQWLDGAVLNEQLSYWRRHLDGISILELPTDQPRRPVMSYRGAQQIFSLPLALSGAIKELGRREGATLFMLLLGAFQVLLNRYTGQDDISIGSPVAGRNRTEIEGLIGFFVNTLVLRTDLSGGPGFLNLLSRVKEVIAAAYAYQDFPFERLVEQLQPSRTLNRTPLFQVMFSLQNAPLSALELPGLRVKPLPVDTGNSKFDLILEMSESGGTIGGALRYNTDLFEPTTIHRMLEHFRTLLEAIVDNPAQSISRLPLLTGGERDQLLFEWNQTEADYPRALPVHKLFETQAMQSPDKVALVFEDNRISYVELDRRANRLAHHLKANGVKQETLVGICLERSVEMVVAMLGILKAGGAYVPLDPAYPTERLAFMIEDARMPLLLTRKNLIIDLPECRAKMIDLDRDAEVISEQSENDCDGGATAENLAYVIYTSGSTGKPKGVQITHSALGNFLSHMRLRPGLSDEDVLLAVTTLSFDIAGLELFLPLIAGGRVVLANREAAAGGELLREQLRGSGATIMQATPSGWRLLIEAGWQGTDHLKILCGGEALPGDLAEELLKRGASVWNMFGPTETTIWSTIHLVETGKSVVSIGRPISNTEIYLMDRGLEIVPTGVPGELYIGGEGLARGYLNRPHLTAERFIPHPFSRKPGARLYKTGDLARYMTGGTIEFLGRADHQVKVRGFRIELGEIEASLMRHPSVREAVVVAREDVPGDKRLMSYIVPVQQEPPSAGELRRFLKDRLPDYMVPAGFEVMESLPLTPNGKVDRKALPAAGNMRPALEAVYVEPQTELEQMIAAAWRESLRLDKVGVDDNFFDLGGHSLLTIQVHNKLRSSFDCDLSIIDLFRFPTISSLAKHLSRQRDEQAAGRDVQQRAETRRTAMKRQRQFRQKNRKTD